MVVIGEEVLQVVVDFARVEIVFHLAHGPSAYRQALRREEVRWGVVLATYRSTSVVAGASGASGLWPLHMAKLAAEPLQTHPILPKGMTSISRNAPWTSVRRPWALASSWSLGSAPCWRSGGGGRPSTAPRWRGAPSFVEKLASASKTAALRSVEEPATALCAPRHS